MELEELKKQIDENSKKLDENTKKIVANMDKIHQNSFALELIKDANRDTMKSHSTIKKLTTIIIIILFLWAATICYLVYVLSDITTIETTQEVSDIDSINGNVVNNGDVYGQN